MNRTIWIATSLLVVTAGTACGGGGGTALEGVYTISTWTENQATCDAEGDSILADRTDKSFYIKEENFLGAEFVNFVLCPSTSDCATQAGEDTIHLDGFSFEGGSDDGGWNGSGYSLGGGLDGPCSGSVNETLLTSPAEGKVRLEVRSKDVSDIGRDSDGFCDSDEAIEKAKSLPCSSLEVVTGDFAQGL